MIITTKPEGVCSGRGCENSSVGSFQEAHMTPEWRKPVEYPNNHRGFELGAVIYYCAEHEGDAKAYLAHPLSAISQVAPLAADGGRTTQ
jgi:hypothetical protein